jgi:hypothetical protein
MTLDDSIEANILDKTDEHARRNLTRMRAAPMHAAVDPAYVSATTLSDLRFEAETTKWDDIRPASL